MKYILTLTTAVALTITGLFGLNAYADGALDSGASFTKDGKSIIFHTFKEGQGEIWLMNLETKQTQKITQGDNNDRWPGLHPDGTKVVFMSTKDANWEIYTVNIDGTNRKRLTENYVFNLGANWSPDGNSIVYAEHREAPDSVSDIWIMNADGSEKHMIVTGGMWPSWSPDGKYLTFARADSETELNIYRYELETKTLLQLTDDMGMATSAAWSPDSQQIYFVAPAADGKRYFYKMRADGSLKERLHLEARIDSAPSFSQDGKRMLYGMDTNGNIDILMYDFETGVSSNLTPW